MLGQGSHQDKTPFNTEDLLKVDSESTSFLEGVNKAWYIQLNQDQAPHPCIKAEQGIPP